MKFEKFLKQVGTHGEVIKVSESQKWLVCGGVGMLIPLGVNNLLGVETNSEYAHIVEVLANTVLDDPLTLKEAILKDPTGGPKDIYRVFETDLGDRVGILNADYGLLEKRDQLGYGEIEIDETDDVKARTIKYILVYNMAGDLIGYITGSDLF